MLSNRNMALSLSGVLVGAGLLWLSIRHVDLESAWQLVLSARPEDLAGTVACTLGFALVKSIRWGWLLRHLQAIRTNRLLEAVMAGTAVNYGVPHAGELVRAWMIAKTEGMKHAAILASIGVERIFDFVAVLVVGLAAVHFAGKELGEIGTYLWVLGGFIVVLLSCVLPFLLWPDKSLNLVARALGKVPHALRDWIVPHLAHGVTGLGALQSAPRALGVLAASVVQWSLMAGCAWFSLHAIGMQPGLALPGLILVLLVVGLTLPAAPGHVGTTQAAFLLAGAPLGVDATQLVAGSLVYNVLVPVTFLVPGIATITRHHLRSPGLERLGKERQPQSGSPEPPIKPGSLTASHPEQ